MPHTRPTSTSPAGPRVRLVHLGSRIGGREIVHRLGERDAGRMNPFAVVAGGRAVGMTTFCDIDQPNRRVEIGYTWLSPTVQRTAVNTAAKLLGHAFEACDAIAVEFRTHWHNRQSRAAIERLGAKQDGVLRNHRLGPTALCATRSCTRSSRTSGRPSAAASTSASRAAGPRSAVDDGDELVEEGVERRAAAHDPLHAVALAEHLDELLEHGLERLAVALREGHHGDDLHTPSPHAIDGSATPTAIAVRVAVIPSACGTASASVNAVDDSRSRSSVRST
jgi:hypothetical protein